MLRSSIKITTLSDLLPVVRCPPAVRLVCKTTSELDTYELLPDEVIATTNFSAKRLKEFKLGRACARELLSGLGFADFPLRVGATRQPLWPEELTGSISHAGDVAICAVVPRQQVAGLGVDIELIAPEPFDLLSTVVSDNELEQAYDKADCGYIAKLLFSAKESVFKCQFPVTGDWLDFKAVSLKLDFDSKLFTTVVTHQNSSIYITGSWDVTEQYILTAAWIS